MKEADIRPDDIFQRYLELSAADADIHFNGVERSTIDCVACGCSDNTHQFEKSGFGFALCNRCGTLFQSPRPPIAAFEAFYRDSVSSRYWAQTFFPAVAEARRERIFRPRVDRLSDLCVRKNVKVERLIDIGAGYGIFLEEWGKRFPDVKLVAVEPSQNLAQVCRAKGFEVAEELAENVRGYDGYADLAACFEVLEHVYEPVSMIRTLSKLVKPGGYVFVTSLGVDGFDIQTLWEKSNSISPPHHINFLSVAGFKAAFERAGLEDIDVSTPGKLDVDIVRNAYKRDPAILENNRFARFMVGDETRAASFQTYLSQNQMSSHVWALARRPV